MASAFLTVPEVARLLRVGQRTAYTLARTGRLGGAVKIGSQWRIDRNLLRGWISAGGPAKPKGRRA